MGRLGSISRIPTAHAKAVGEDKANMLDCAGGRREKARSIHRSDDSGRSQAGAIRWQAITGNRGHHFGRYQQSRVNHAED